jgi:hypothetical protein
VRLKDYFLPQKTKSQKKVIAVRTKDIRFGRNHPELYVNLWPDKEHRVHIRKGDLRRRFFYDEKIKIDPKVAQAPIDS